MADPTALTFDRLRQAGVEKLRRLTGTSWTDHNAHDPGITILEYLCYALSDLAYRSDFSVADLLASGDVEAPDSLFPAREILPTNPVTLDDWRKLVLDVRGVRNAWVEVVENPEPVVYFDPTDRGITLAPAPHRERVPMRGIIQVWIDVDGDSATVLAEVSRRLHAHRNLGEDFLGPKAFLHQGVTVDGEIEIGEAQDPERLLAEVLHALELHLRPRIRFSSLDEMLEAGESVEALFDGPLLSRGFLRPVELAKEIRRTSLRTSDLVQVILDVPGTRAVHGLDLSDGGEPQSWFLPLDPKQIADLAIGEMYPSALVDVSSPRRLRLRKGSIEIPLDHTRLMEELDHLRAQTEPVDKEPGRTDLQRPAGRDRKVGEYQSIQHEFPRTYGIGEGGPPKSAGHERRGPAKQLKAYLMLFEQLLANSHSQLAGIADLFALRVERETPRTYFTQTLKDVPGVQDILGVAPLDRHLEVLKNLVEPPELTAGEPGDTLKKDEAAHERKNRMLNHLLARFGEELTDRALVRSGSARTARVVEDKIEFLKDYPLISGGRGSAFDYTLPSWNNDNVGGLERRVRRKLGLQHVQRRDLADLDAADEGGLHLVEHILLRPQQEDVDQWSEAERARWQAADLIKASGREDPYSLQISVVLPNWITEWNAPAFRTYLRQMIREETPAHLSVREVWLDQDKMRSFEAAYQTWLQSLIAQRPWNPE